MAKTYKDDANVKDTRKKWKTGRATTEKDVKKLVGPRRPNPRDY